MVQSSPYALVIAATSSLGGALCRQVARKGWRLAITGRNEAELAILAQDLRLRGAVAVECVCLDLRDENFMQLCQPFLEEVSDVFMLAGVMHGDDNDAIEHYPELMQVNYIAPAMILAEVTRHMAAREAGVQGGRVSVVASVAGDRGRASNYAYGSSKAALATFADGLRHRYAKQNVHVMTVKPGFIETPMTHGLQTPLMATREQVAQDIVRAHMKRENICYTPWFWRWIMLIIRHIPESVFKRLTI